MINRREFLKVGSALLAGGLASATSMPVQANPAEASILHEGVNLAGWRVKLGDVIYPKDGSVTKADIGTVHLPGYSEVRANVKRRAIMAHNITYKLIANPDALQYIHTCSISFRLPYLPVPDQSATLNGQTVECGIFIWDGPNTRFDYGTAFQWLVNPWGDKSTAPGAIRVWNGKSWSRVGQMALDTAWHTAKMVVDFKRKSTLLLIDDKYQLSRFSKTAKPASWGNTVDARFQAEAVSIDPRPDNLMKALHKVQVKDWKWLWETASC